MINSTALAITAEQIEFTNYCHTRHQYSFETLKRKLGHDTAVAFEVSYQGAATLETQSREALAQINRILTALGRPVLLRWPVEERSTCDVCDASVPASHMKGTGYFDSVNEFAVDGPGCCRKCREMEDVEASDWTPVDEALGLPIFQCSDFWYCQFKTSAEAVQLASAYPCCDVVDLETETTMTANEAARRLDNPTYSEFEKFGLSFPETLNCFLTDLCAGLYPSLESK